MPVMKIVLVTLHSRYIHASLALPCLAAVVSGIDGIETVIREFTVNEPQSRVLRSLAGEGADLIAFSCYIWNVEPTRRLASDLKRLMPGMLIAAGGPEVSYTAEGFLQENEGFDCVIRGEGEKTWLEFIAAMARQGASAKLPDPMPKGVSYRSGAAVIRTPDREAITCLDSIPSPFVMGLVDTSKPLVYYETSRGCPFSCAFCLSSLEKGVRSFSPERIREDLLHLMENGASVVKLVDRTFNYDAERADEIWDFIIANNRVSRFHFEIAGDLLTDGNLRTLRRVPKGMFRFEIGVQATGKETLARVERKSDTERLLSNVKRLTGETGVTIHLDLVAGLPGEDFTGFLGSLRRLFPVRPHHIQVEPLKVLKGSPMADIAAHEGYAHSANPPYTILKTPVLSFAEIGRIEDISRLLDLYYNSGRFIHSLDMAGHCRPLSVFFDEMSLFLGKEPGSEGISLKGLFDLIWRFAQCCFNEKEVEEFRDALRYDFCLVEYPPVGALPPFFRDETTAPRENVPKEIMDTVLSKVERPPQSRVRTFTARFMRDFSTTPHAEGPVRLIFVYVSIPGEGLRVRVLPCRFPE
jgi:anaerobic magnesium-protoporphyrin IX monomethyl ester cyclase